MNIAMKRRFIGGAQLDRLPLRLTVVNKQERTYTIIKDRIHVGSIAPLQRLNIDAIARELGVSPIPVREALRRLEAEGWVRFTPNVGAVVSPVDATTWEQAMVALAILEGAASGEAAPHLRKSDLTRLRKIAAAMEEAAAHADPRRFSRLNRTLHAVIVARCPNTCLTEMLAQTNARLDRLAESPEDKCRAQDLAESVHLSQSALSRLVDRLVKNALVERCACDNDRRGIFVVLTAEGRRRQAEAAVTHRDVLARLLPVR